MSREELEKLTATKLRELAAEYPEIQGAHAMKKEELIIAILKARGEPISSKKKDAHISDVKKEIRKLKTEKEKALQEGDKKKITQLRKKIKQLKRITRQLAEKKSA
ncbi:MAG: Rho termination factor N-terminal domain-containing protein [Desulfobacterota bacterium]|nr:Rho termination factor N-terminal domain-containing protein [Thermodesulfobacteriota bacterium]